MRQIPSLDIDSSRRPMSIVSGSELISHQQAEDGEKEVSLVMRDARAERRDSVDPSQVGVG